MKYYNFHKKQPLKRVFFILTTLAFFYNVGAQESSRIVDNNGVSIDGGDFSGLQSGVNMFTGDVQFPLNLVSLPGENGGGINLSISYNSNVNHLVNRINEESPTGILGLGWNMDMPMIQLDHKGTGNIHDDEYYLVSGGSPVQLYYTGSGSYYSPSLGINFATGVERFESATYSNWIIRYIRARERWEITLDDGTVVTYGGETEHPSSVQYVVKWGNWIGDSDRVIDQSQMAFVWNQSEVFTFYGETVTYTYEKVERKVGVMFGELHTEASYLLNVENSLGYEVDFVYDEKQEYEFYEPHTEVNEQLNNVYDAYQERYERKYLDQLIVSYDGNPIKIIDIQYYSLNKLSNSDQYKKRLISGITSTDKFDDTHNVMSFDYYTSGFQNGMMKTATTPTGAIVTYTYRSQQIGDLDLTINAPAGYSEPQVWQGPGYTVVGWRQLNS